MGMQMELEQRGVLKSENHFKQDAKMDSNWQNCNV